MPVSSVQRLINILSECLFSDCAKVAVCLFSSYLFICFLAVLIEDKCATEQVFVRNARCMEWYRIK